LAGGLAEGAWLGATGGEPIAPLTVSVGLWLALTPLLYGLLVRVQYFASSTPIKTLRQRASIYPEEFAAIGLLLGLSIAVLGAGLPWADAAISGAVKDGDLVPQAVAILAVLWALASTLIGILGFAILPRVIITLPAPLLYVIGVLGFVAPVIWALWSPIDILSKDLPLRPAYLLGMAFAVGWGSMYLGRRARNAVVGVSLLGAVLFAAASFTPSIYGGQPAVRLALDDGHGLVPHLVGVVHRLTDRDGDGFSPYLAGGDCDDDNDSIHPMAVDLPGNGVDENCRGGDRPRLQVRAREPVKRGTLPKSMVRPWNVLFLTIDSLRPDRLEIYGYARKTAPNIARLAAKGLVFERAYSPANNTRFAIPSMFSGRMVAELDAERLGLYTVLGTENNFIFDRLNAAQWHTEAHLPEQLFRGMWYGLDSRFDVYRGHADAKLKTFSAKAIGAATSTAIKGLSRQMKPWALWAHFVDPHEPYRTHPGHDFGKTEADRYDSEIAGVDAAIGRILESLDSVGATENTLIFITSDHGEEFGEHGRRFHGKQLFEESIRVPLVMVVPGAPAKRVAAPVSLVDLPETVAHLTGLPAGLDYGNISLADVYTDRALSGDRSLFAESIRNPADIRRRQVALINGMGKAIVTVGRDKVRLYDLAADPGEKTNLAGRASEALKGHLDTLRAQIRRQEAILLEDIRARQVSMDPPPGLGDVVELAPGFELLGANVGYREFGVDRCIFLRTWFRAGGDRKNYRLRFEVVNAAGKILRKWTLRPLLGLYPTDKWAAGEVVEEGRVIRVRKLTGKLTFRVKVLAKKRVVSGPHHLAEFEVD